jgi:hypothetical protein
MGVWHWKLGLTWLGGGILVWAAEARQTAKKNKRAAERSSWQKAPLLGVETHL